jgi:hypothetical protein
VCAADGDEVGLAGAGADEIHFGLSLSGHILFGSKNSQ